MRDVDTILKAIRQAETLPTISNEHGSPLAGILQTQSLQHLTLYLIGTIETNQTPEAEAVRRTWREFKKACIKLRPGILARLRAELIASATKEGADKLAEEVG